MYAQWIVGRFLYVIVEIVGSGVQMVIQTKYAYKGVLNVLMHVPPVYISIRLYAV